MIKNRANIYVTGKISKVDNWNFVQTRTNIDSLFFDVQR